MMVSGNSSKSHLELASLRLVWDASEEVEVKRNKEESALDGLPKLLGQLYEWHGSLVQHM